MTKLVVKLFFLSIIILFAQCSKLGFVERRYNKGHYKENRNQLSQKTHSPKKNASTDSVTRKEHKTADELKVKAGEVAVAQTQPDKKDTLTNAGAETKTEIAARAKTQKPKHKLIDFNAIQKLDKKEFEQRKANTFAKIPGTKALIQKKANKEANGENISLVATILAIVGFVAGLAAFISTFYAVFDTIIGLINYASYISPVFIMALILGAVALGCGITTLVMGKGDLEGYQRTFAILAIVFGAVAIILSGIWSLLFLALA